MFQTCSHPSFASLVEETKCFLSESSINRSILTNRSTRVISKPACPDDAIFQTSLVVGSRREIYQFNVRLAANGSRHWICSLHRDGGYGDTDQSRYRSTGTSECIENYHSVYHKIRDMCLPRSVIKETTILGGCRTKTVTTPFVSPRSERTADRFS
jgi:hypothetical protein